jgi:hypothetical protein
MQLFGETRLEFSGDRNFVSFIWVRTLSQFASMAFAFT